MAGNPSTSKVMRIGIFQGESPVEERLLRKRSRVTIGQTLANTFVVPASTMPATYKIFDVDKQGAYVLRVNDRMGGRLSLNGTDVIDLTRLRGVPAARAVADGFEITLSDKARGKVTIGNTRILFQFVPPPAASIGMLPAALGGGALAGFSTFLGPAILLAVAVSALLQIGPLFAVMVQDWPEPEGFQELPDWYLDQEAEVLEEEEDKEEEEEKDDEGEGEADDSKKEDAQEAPSESEVKPTKPTPRESAAKATPAEKRMKKEQGKKMFGQVFGVEGGDASIGTVLASNIVGSDAAISALEGLSADDIGGSGGPSAGLGLGLGLGEGGDATGEPGLKGVEGGGANELIGAGPTIEPKETPRQAVKLKVQEDTQIPDSVEKGDKSGIESVFRQKGKQVENCYKRVIQKYGDQKGKLVVKITIGADGTVLKVTTSVDQIGKGLAACVEGKIKRWKFPKVGKPVTVAKRWVFG